MSTVASMNLFATLKVSCGGEVFRIGLYEEPTFELITNKIIETLPAHSFGTCGAASVPKMTFVDDEGDTCTLTAASFSTYLLAHRESEDNRKTKILKISVQNNEAHATGRDAGTEEEKQSDPKMKLTSGKPSGCSKGFEDGCGWVGLKGKGKGKWKGKPDGRSAEEQNWWFGKGVDQMGKGKCRACKGWGKGKKGKHGCKTNAATEVSGPCSGGCGFAKTWHETHCCVACLVSNGQMHGPQCAAIEASTPVLPVDDNCAAQGAVLPPRDDSHLFGKGTGKANKGKCWGMKGFGKGKHGKCGVNAVTEASGPCAGECGFAKTWHETHCCVACLVSSGQMHGPQCAASGASTPGSVDESSGVEGTDSSPSNGPPRLFGKGVGKDGKGKCWAMKGFGKGKDGKHRINAAAEVSGPCSGECGFAKTWHETHCCIACLESNGQKHGPMCAAAKACAPEVEDNSEMEAVPSTATDAQPLAFGKGVGKKGKGKCWWKGCGKGKNDEHCCKNDTGGSGNSEKEASTNHPQED